MLKTVAVLLCLAALCPATFYSRESAPCYVWKCLAGNEPVPCARGEYIITRAKGTWRQGPVTARILDCGRQPLPHGEVQVFGRVIGVNDGDKPYLVLWDGARNKIREKIGLCVFTEFATHFKPGLFVRVECVLQQARVADAQGGILVLGYRE